MAISDEMVKILCCPVTKQPVRLIDKSQLAKLNEKITQGSIKDKDGAAVRDSVEDALITEDGKTIYRIDDDIPVMLAVAGIDSSQLSK